MNPPKYFVKHLLLVAWNTYEPQMSCYLHISSQVEALFEPVKQKWQKTNHIQPVYLVTDFFFLQNEWPGSIVICDNFLGT